VDLEPKPVSASQVEMTEIVNPGDTNPLGTVFGGHVMALIDKAAAVASIRHCRRTAVTASVDRIDFIAPVRLGMILVLLASVNQAFRTSMEVGVKVFAEDPLTGQRKHACTSYATFVALDAEGRSVHVPPLLLQTEVERRRARDAEERRRIRLAKRG
jgi:acyl-CoA hydrolase